MQVIRFTLVALALLIAPDLAQAQNRVALVIGNGAYSKVPALPNPTNDAEDIAASMTRLGFSVRTVLNGKFDDMRRALIEFGREARDAEVAIVFFAGHGMEIGGENWLIPTDAELLNDTDAENEAINLKAVTLQVSKARQLGLVILDACRNNPFSAKMTRSLRTRAVPRGLAATEPTDNVLVAYAARDGTTANDGTGRNSPFTRALLANLEKPIEVSFMFRHVRDEVMAATQREQQPFVYGSLSKDAIYLKAPDGTPGASQIAAAPPAAAPQPSTVMRTTESADRVFGVEDARRVVAIAGKHKMKVPDYKFSVVDPKIPAEIRSFVGVWASETGFNGVGRQMIMIVTSAAADGVLNGFILQGEPGKESWRQSPAFTHKFTGKISGGTLRFKSAGGPDVTAKMNGSGIEYVMTRRDTKEAFIALEPVWTLTGARTAAR